MKTHHLQSGSETESAENELYQAITSLKTPTESRQFFEDLCTPTEIQAMADRWRVVALIKAGKPYRKIYEETGVSMTTISRVARCIALGKNGYNLIYQRVTHANRPKTPHRHSKKRSPE